MYITQIFSLMMLSIPLLLISLIWFISMKTFMDREKASPFECGFDPKSAARLPFSLHFFLIAVIFLIFDVEITLLMPFIIIMKYSMLKDYLYIFSLFLVILIIGLFHEWTQGSLTWSK